MAQGTWSIKKLGSSFRVEDKKEKFKKIEADIAQAESLQKILVNDNWPVVQGVLDSLKNQAVTELSQRALNGKEMERLNHRFEMLKDIQNAFDSIMNRGTEALKAFNKLKEKNDAR